MTRALLADDHALVRQGLRALLEREGVQVVGEAGDGREAIRLAESLAPDVAILDVGMPVLNGIDAAREMARTCPRVRTVLLTMHTHEAYVVAALRAGARGYLLKSSAASALVEAVRIVLAGQVYLGPDVSSVVVDALLEGDPAATDPLTPRERQVLQLVAEGKSTKEVAALLGTSVKTADSHRARLMHKLDIHDVATLVRYAIRSGIVQV